MYATEEGALRVAVRAAQAYCDRWQIETSFQAVKQEFALEKARVRTFRRLENIFSLCILAYVFATDFLRRAKGFKKVLKYLSDNLEAVSMRTHALLAGIRALVNVEKIRFISGRPRKPFAESPLQMVMDLWAARAREALAQRECTAVKRREDSAKPNPEGAQASARSLLCRPSEFDPAPCEDGCARHAPWRPDWRGDRRRKALRHPENRLRKKSPPVLDGAKNIFEPMFTGG